MWWSMCRGQSVRRQPECGVAAGGGEEVADDIKDRKRGVCRRSIRLSFMRRTVYKMLWR